MGLFASMGVLLLNYFEQLLSKKLILVTGKGGIGKTMTTSAIAQMAVECGLKVCIVESSSQDQLAPLFGSAHIGHKMVEVAPSLTAINLDPEMNFKDFVVIHMGYARLFEKVFTKPIVRSFIRMLPGVSELTLLGRLFYISQLSQEFDLTIFDGFASGHFLSLMKTPDAVLNSGMVGPIMDETQRVRDYMHNREKTGVLLVAGPEQLIVNEALEFSDRFYDELGMELDGVLVNRCLTTVQNKIPDQSIIEDKTAPQSALIYLRDRYLREAESLVQLYHGMVDHCNRTGVRPFVSLLPDLGGVDEPLSNDFTHRLFDQSQTSFDYESKLKQITSNLI